MAAIGRWWRRSPSSRIRWSWIICCRIDAAPGEHTIAVRVQDDYDNLATDKTVVR